MVLHDRCVCFLGLHCATFSIYPPLLNIAYLFYRSPGTCWHMCTVHGSGAKKRKIIGFWSAMARWNGYVEGSAQHANTCGFWWYKKRKGANRCLVEPPKFEKKGSEIIGSEVRFGYSQEISG